MDPGAAHVSNLQQQDLEDRDDQKEEVEPIGHGALHEGLRRSRRRAVSSSSSKL